MQSYTLLPFHTHGKTPGESLLGIFLHFRYCHCEFTQRQTEILTLLITFERANRECCWCSIWSVC